VGGDFNLIYKEEDKNNGRLNRRWMRRFRSAQIEELVLIGRRYTWSNTQSSPTLERLGGWNWKKPKSSPACCVVGLLGPLPIDAGAADGHRFLG
jgi:hypothetical protein